MFLSSNLLLLTLLIRRSGSVDSSFGGMPSIKKLFYSNYAYPCVHEEAGTSAQSYFMSINTYTHLIIYDTQLEEIPSKRYIILLFTCMSHYCMSIATYRTRRASWVALCHISLLDNYDNNNTFDFNVYI